MPGKTQSIILGGALTGVVTALVSQIPLLGSCIACLGYIAAGIIAVWHYTNTNELTLETGAGAGMGALAGIVAMLVASLISYVMMSMGLIPGIQEILDQMAESGQMPDEQLEVIENLLSSPLMYVAFLGIGSIIGAILGAMGGAIGSNLFKKGGSPTEQ